MINDRIRFLTNAAYFAVIIAAAYLLLRYALPVVLPFAAAFLIAAALRRAVIPLCGRLSRIPEKVIAFTVLLIFYSVAGLIVALVVEVLFSQLIDFLAALPGVLSGLVSGVLDSREVWLEYLPSWLRGSLGSIEKSEGELLMSAVNALSAPLLELVGAAGTLAMKVPTLVLAVLVTVTASFFILLDYEGACSLLRSLIPEPLARSAERVRRCACRTVLHMLKSYGILAFITFAELCCGFALLNLFGAGIAYAVPLSLLISAVDILPVLGVGTVLLPWSAACFLSGDARLGGMLLGLYGIIAIARNILEPRLVGGRLGVNPALTLLALYVGGKLFGLLGMFLLPFAVMMLLGLRQESADGSATA